MGITRRQVEERIGARCGALLTMIDQGGTDGAQNLFLTDPLHWSLVAMGYAPDDWGDVTDADLAEVPGTSVPALLDVIEWRTLEAILGNMDRVTVTTGPIREEWEKVAARLEIMIGRKRKEVAARYGDFLSVDLDDDYMEATIAAL